MKAIKNGLQIGLSMISAVAGIAGMITGGWHLVVIAICASVVAVFLEKPVVTR